MAEVAGLVLGAIGVAGVLGAFKDTIDLFGLFVTSRELGRDYEILNIKLDIEKTLLLQWADRVGLLRQYDYDRRLDQEATQEAVIKILSCIRLLLSEASTMREKYNLLETDEQSVPSRATRSLSISAPRMRSFNDQFDTFKKRMAQHEKGTSLRDKIRWTIRDKESFENLIRELAHFTTKLNEVIPVVTGQPTSQSMADEDLKTISDLKDLKLMLEASSDLHKTLADSARRNISRKCEEIILNQLWFRKIHQRKEDVGMAHHKTLEWALNPPQKDVRWDNLPDWLRTSSHGIYWISGKAGSGKSTLMKYLLSHQRTHKLISNWARDSPCIVVDHFFYNLGTEEQKRFEGLSRALLYQMLSPRPSLIYKALPNMMKELRETDHGPSFPSQSEIKYAFRVLSAESSIEKYCIFLDGLDEFEGNIQESLSLIHELGSSSNIKLIVSSRPIPPCVAAYEDLPKLHLQDLTKNDIQAYVRDVIGDHKYMNKLLRRNAAASVAAEEIMKDLVEKSSGVFLWVVLACRSLLLGFGDCDRLPELRRRVNELPHELEDLFALMLARISERHKKQGAYLLRVCFESQRESQKPNSIAFSYMSTLALALVDDSEIDVSEIRDFSVDDKVDLCAVLEGRLRSRCGGLLETASSHEDCFCDPHVNRVHGTHDTHNNLIDSTVVFMHRTVFEFLSNEAVWDYDCLKMVNYEQALGTDLSLRDLYLMMLQVARLRQLGGSEKGRSIQAKISRLIRSGIFWAQKGGLKAVMTFFNSLPTFLDELASCLGAARVRVQAIKGLRGPEPDAPVPEGTTDQCTYYHTTEEGNDCKYLEEYWGISHDQFVRWNPSVKEDCSGIKPDHSYCVEVNNGGDITTSIGSSASPTATGNPIPSPTLDGTAQNCDAWHFVDKGDDCGKITSRYGISMSQFREWNKNVEDDCSGLWSQYWFCVSVEGHDAPTVTTGPSPTGNPAPSPTLDGTAENCDAFHFVKKGDSCESITKTYGISMEQFVEWNDNLKSGCTGLWAEYFFCVSVEGHKPTELPPRPTSTLKPGPSPTPDDTVNNCDKFHFVVKDETCEKICANYSITMDQFTKWNPSVKTDCSGLWAQMNYCVSIEGHSPATSKTSSVSSKTTSVSTGGPPAPTQTGIVKDCTDWHVAKSGDDCSKIVAKYGNLDLARFIQWNPAVGSTCNGLWLDTAYCVGTKTNPAKPPNINPPPTGCQNTPKNPEPTQPGAICKCKKWHKIVNGDSCWSLAQKYKVTEAQLKTWNAGTNCNMWLGYHVCVQG
ncbi:LysM domain-containing protein [Paramyrothecium foliicola]|nr:LysM domain-containing protein [Paramyrothecium foliicola]